MSQALREMNDGKQLGLYGRGMLRARTMQPPPTGPTDSALRAPSGPPELRRRRKGPALPKLCAGCRAREARYGFRDEADPQADRPQTLCFDCFRMEIARRQAVAAQLARGWNASQARLPLDDTLKELSLRRRRAQIAARHALE
jgi:hypothetical protein